jgi:uncharacterized damage-inducible protein DinB
MSVFTNPASASAAHAEAYTKALLALLGSADPLTVLRGTSFALRRAVEGLDESELGVPERAGKWSIRQVLRHLADSDLVWAWRLRLVLAQDRPQITGYDQDAWAERLGYAAAPAAESLEEFSVVRRGNVRLLEQLVPDDLQRVGVHVERGEESVEHMMRLYAGHDLLHLRQIERIRAVVSG